MVCKKCGRSFNDNFKTCPFCGVGQENQINIKRLENELEKLKIEDETSSFCSNKNASYESTLDIEDIIYDLEELKIKETNNEDIIVPRVEPVSDEDLIELIEDIKENKDLFITDKSQYQYQNKPEKIIDISNKKVEIFDIENKALEKQDNTQELGIRDLYNKQRLYNYDKVNNEKPEIIEIPKSITEEYSYKPYKSKKGIKNKKEIIICIVVFVISLIILTSIISKFMFNPKMKLINNIKESYTKIQNVIDKYTINFNELLEYDDISISSTTKINTIDNKNTNNEIINIKYIENKSDKKQYYEYTNLNNKKSIYNKMFIKENKLYINRENQSNEYYYTDARFISILNNQNKINREYLLDIFLNTIKSTMNNDMLKIDSVKENDERLKEYTYKISNKIILNYINEIKKDEKAINILIDTFDYSKVELMNKLDDLSNKSSNMETITYKLYINGNKKIVKQYLNYDNYEMELYNNEEIILKISKDNNEILYLKLKEVDSNKNRYSINLNYDNFKLLGDFYEEDNKIIINFQKNNTSKIKSNEVMNIVITRSEKQDKKYTNNIDINYQKTDDGVVTSKNINSSNVITVDTKIPEIDINNNSQLITNNLKNELKENFSIFIK